jgi:hypothetical protein
MNSGTLRSRKRLRICRISTSALMCQAEAMTFMGANCWKTVDILARCTYVDTSYLIHNKFNFSSSQCLHVILISHSVTA